MTEWLLENGPYAGRRVHAWPGRMLEFPIESTMGVITALYVPVRMDGAVIVARYEGFRA